jgi:cytochrome c2
MRTCCLFLVVSALLSATARPAAAVLQFYKVWETEYLTNHPDQDYAALAKKPANRCFVCHEGKNRKNRNEYGSQLAELLDAKKDKKDTDKILAAIKQVGEMHVDPNDDTSETFNQRIAASKFPGGELEELKKKPAE